MVLARTRQAFDRLERSRTIPRLDDRPVWAIVCFVVGESVRGMGLTRALIDAAVAYAADHGAPAIEAYPADMGEGRITAAAAYVGSLSTFLAAGFELVSRHGFRRPAGGRGSSSGANSADQGGLRGLHPSGHIKG